MAVVTITDVTREKIVAKIKSGSYDMEYGQSNDLKFVNLRFSGTKSLITNNSKAGNDMLYAIVQAGANLRNYNRIDVYVNGQAVEFGRFNIEGGISSLDFIYYPRSITFAFA